MDQLPIFRMFDALPPVTKAWLCGALGTAVAVKLGWVTPMQLYFRYQRVVHDGELWRILTSLTYFGEFGEKMLMRLFLYLQHSRLLEESDYLGQPLEYIWILTIAAAIIIAMSVLIVPVGGLSTSICFAVIYLWARRSTTVNVALMGVFEIPASYYPYISFAINFLFAREREGEEAIYSLVYGMFAGHFLFFFEDVYPRYDPGTRFLAPPWKWFRVHDHLNNEQVPPGQEPEPAAQVPEQINEARNQAHNQLLNAENDDNRRDQDGELLIFEL